MQLPRRYKFLCGFAFLLCARSSFAQPLLPSGSTAPTTTRSSHSIVSTTNGSVTMATGANLGFTAEAGIIAVHGEEADNASLAGSVDAADGRPIARMSYVAYFAHETDPTPRPILFLWDGGPGASSRSLVVDSFGPVRVEVPAPGQVSKAPPSIANNPDCLLDAADLVFIDAPGTGFGHIEGPDAASKFYGIDGDAAAFAHFIERFLVTHNRQQAPLFLFGHSYGTMRAPVVARLLGEDELPPRGIVSVSQWLNNDDNVEAAKANPGTDNAYVDVLPSYAATAWYHHRLGDRYPTLAALLAKAEAFALGDYANALLAGSILPAGQAQAIAGTLESLTAVPASIWLKADLRIDSVHFVRLVLDDPDSAVARLDARYVGRIADPLASTSQADPYGSAIGSSLAVAGDQYERDVLGFGRTAAFSPDADVPNLNWGEYHSTDGKPWDSFFNVIPDLASVMIKQPGTRFLLMGGYYDLGTTYFGALQEIRHLPIPSTLRANIDTAFFPTGHGLYQQDDVRQAMHDRIAEFLHS